MHAWEQIQITVDYIEKHLSEEIKIENLAKLALLSQFYYQRLFSRLVKRPVNEYIKLRRLAKASEALLYKNRRILDIALDYGFSSHETLTRNFKDILFAVLTCILSDVEQMSSLKDIKRVLKPNGILYVNDFMLNTNERNRKRYEQYMINIINMVFLSCLKAQL